MTRRKSIINEIISMVITVGTLIALVLVANANYGAALGEVILYFICGAIVVGFLCTLFHEAGHIIAGKRNGFALLSVSVWFFKWVKENGRTVFHFTFLGEEAGATEMAARSTENLSVRLKKMTYGGLIATFIPMMLGVIPFFLTGYLPVYAFIGLGMFLPIGAYVFFGNALPTYSGGAGNDGKLIYDLKTYNDDAKVALSMIAVQSELFNGKTPAEIDAKYYDDLPQLAENDLNFLILLSARLDRFVDLKDFGNAKKTLDRLKSVTEYYPKSVETVVALNELYAACTYDKNFSRADEIVEDFAKYLDKHNGSLEIRAKLAYILYVKGEREHFDVFYRKGVKEANKLNLRGQGIFERKLLEEMKKDFER